MTHGHHGWWWWLPLENNHPELHPGQSDDRTRRSRHRVAESYPRVTPKRSTKEVVPGLPKCHSQSGRSAERKLFHKGKGPHVAGHIPLSLQCAEQEKRRTVEDHRAQETCKEHRQKNPVKKPDTCKNTCFERANPVITSSIQTPHGRYTRTTLQLKQEPLKGSSYADIAKRTVGNPWIPQCPSRGRSHHDANSNEGTSTSNEPWDCESRNRRKCKVETLQRSAARRGEKGQAIRISNEART